MFSIEWEGLQRVMEPRQRFVPDATVGKFVEVHTIGIAICAIVRLWVSGWDVDPLPAATMIGDYI